MVERQQDVLRLQPHMIPAFRTSVAAALDQLDVALVHLRQKGHLCAPWMGDEVSGEVAAHYTVRAVDGPESSYGSLVAYRDELTRSTTPSSRWRTSTAAPRATTPPGGDARPSPC